MSDTIDEAVTAAAAAVEVAGTEAGSAAITGAADVVEEKKEVQNDIHAEVKTVWARIKEYVGVARDDIVADIEAIEKHLGL